MLRTALCDLLGIEIPVIQAPMAACTSGELAAAVSNAGGMGSLASGQASLQALEEQLTSARELTDRPIAVNHGIPFLDQEAFDLTLEARPAVISFALGDPADLLDRAHAASILVMQMVNTVAQAQQAARIGVDIINVQGSEAGGFSGAVSTMCLVPQVVDVAGNIPVVASGGIADGRGLAAAIALGAQGVSIGTRFLASMEAPVDQMRKQSVIDATSEDVVKVVGWNEIFPLTGSAGYDVTPSVLANAFTEECAQVRGFDEEGEQRLRARLTEARQQGRMHDLLPLTGQSAGAIHDIKPAGEIVRQIADEAVTALGYAARLVDR